MKDKYLVKIVTDARIEPEVREDAWTDLVTGSADGIRPIIYLLEKAVSEVAVILFNYRSRSECFELADDLVKWWIRRVDNASKVWKSDYGQDG